MKIAALILTAGALWPQALQAAEPFFTEARRFELAAKKEFKGLGKDFSGVAYVPEAGRYFVLDDECKILEMSVEAGEIAHKRTVKLRGLKDCEAIAILPDKKGIGVAVVEEARGNLVLFSLAPEASSVDCSRGCLRYRVDKVTELFSHNAGLEALAVDLSGPDPVFYLGKEEMPKKLYRAVLEGPLLRSSVPWDAEALLPEEADIAEIAVFEGSLFLLDERQEIIRQVDAETGAILSSFALPAREWDLLHRYEGLSIVRRNGAIEMVVAAEKNEVMVYRSEG